MSERERWVVYPLLFLALGAALRDKLVDRTTTKRIVCQELRIEDEPVGNQPAQVLAIIGREPKPTGNATGFFYLNGNMDIIDGDPAGVSQPAARSSNLVAPSRCPGLFQSASWL